MQNITIEGKEYRVVNDVITSKNFTDCVWLNNVRYGLAPVEEKKVLFTTEDGVEITDEEQIVYYIVGNTVKERKARFMLHHSNHKFSDKEKAEDFIVMNTQCLSINDIKGVLFGSDYSFCVDLVRAKLIK